MTTMKDVARLAGVSTATVSRSLSSPETVSPETVSKVMEAVRKLNYEPNILARNLRTNATMFIIVVLPDITNPFFGQILRGIEEVAHAAGYTVLLCDTANDPNRELTYTNILRRRGADGIIFLTARVDRSHMLHLATSKPMVLACEYIEGLPVPQVAIDNMGAGLMATQHLLRLGHRRIGLVNGPENVILCRDRRNGYRLALQHAGIALDPALTTVGEFDYQSGRQAVRQLLALPEPPTAIFCASDQLAMGVINEARSMGLRVPDDLAVVGFDDIGFAEMFHPQLSTIAQPMHEIGETAMRLLLSVIHCDDESPRQVVLPHSLVIRESCGAHQV